MSKVGKSEKNPWVGFIPPCPDQLMRAQGAEFPAGRCRGNPEGTTGRSSCGGHEREWFQIGALRNRTSSPTRRGGMSRSVALVTFDSIYPRSFVSVSFPRWFRDEKGKSWQLYSTTTTTPTPKKKKTLFFSLLYFLVPVSGKVSPYRMDRFHYLWCVCLSIMVCELHLVSHKETPSPLSSENSIQTFTPQ